MTDPAGSRKARRRHPARDARILTAGVSAAAMFGIVAALGIGTVEADPTEPPAPTVVVVDPGIPATRSVVVTELSAQPIQLTANPVVRAAPRTAAPQPVAPVARTNGSR